MKKNILAAFFLKGFSVLVSFLLVPLTLGYLNEYEYGIWLTLNSVLSWIYMFDIGLGNGLRNRLTEALAKDDSELGRIYVSTSFFGMSVIGILIFAIYLLLHGFVDWYAVFNVDCQQVGNLPEIISIVVGIVCIIFVFKIAGNIFMSLQMPAINDMMVFAGSLLSLVIIYILTKTTSGSLKDVAVTFTVSSAVVYIIAFMVIVMRYGKIAPSIHYVKLSYFKNLMSLGVNFMIIQIAVLVIFMTSNLIISNLFGPSEVTPYNISFKYFSIVAMVFSLIINPVWSAVTDASTRGDFTWISNMTRRMTQIWILSVICLAILVVFSGTFYRWWVGAGVDVPFTMSIWMAIYMAITTLANLYANIINGFGKIRVQLIFAICQAVIYIPLAVWFGTVFGVIGILLALCAVCSIGAVLNVIQTHKLLSGNAGGLWIK